jgi:NAD(P)-dependent dehydrogenase (short-subunit alcohol dehydrogenase family)
MSEADPMNFTRYGSLEGRTVIITGGASGIGACFVRAFVENGAKVAFLDQQHETGATLADSLGETLHQEGARSRHQLFRNRQPLFTRQQRRDPRSRNPGLCPPRRVVITTKVYGRMRPGPNGAGLSRKAIFAEIDASLGRLGMD